MATSIKTYSRILNVFIGLTIIVIAAIVHLTLAKATIVLPQNTEVFTLDTPVEIANGTSDNQIYGEVMTKEVTGTITYQVGNKTVTSEKAAVTVTIINNYSKSQPLVKTTRLQSDNGILYRLTEGVTVPAGGSVKVVMEADQTGTDQIVQAGHFTIPGLWTGLQDKIYGETKDASTFERNESSLVTTEDIEAAKVALIEQEKPGAIEQLQADLPDGLKLKPEQLVGRVTNSTVDAEIGDSVEKFQLEGDIVFEALLFDQDLLLTAAQQKLKEKLPTGIEVIEYKNDTFNYQVTEIDTTKETALVNLHLEALVTTKPTTLSFEKTELKGLTKSEAEAYLSERGFQNATVELWPFWVRHIPGLGDHIKLETRN